MEQFCEVMVCLHKLTGMLYCEVVGFTGNLKPIVQKSRRESAHRQGSIQKFCQGVGGGGEIGVWKKEGGGRPDLVSREGVLAYSNTYTCGKPESALVCKILISASHN